MKIFKTKSKEVFNCSLPSVSVNNRKCKFLQKISASENIICRHCVDYGSVQGPRKNTASFVCRNLKIPFLEI